MCIATLMRVLRVDGYKARCLGRHGEEADIDLALVAAAPVGAWLLTSQGTAREILDEERAAQVGNALGALEAALRGDCGAIDVAFADLIGRVPPLPDFPH